MNYIRAIEKWIVLAIQSSADIPDHVHVRSLADSREKEGVIDMVSNISVAYQSASSTVISNQPFVCDKTLSFEITYVIQDYLAETGHSLATELMLKVEQLLNGKVPMIAGNADTLYFEIENPFVVRDDRFEGISEIQPIGQYYDFKSRFTTDIIIFSDTTPTTRSNDFKIF
jgi:hypothetical protein